MKIKDLLETSTPASWSEQNLERLEALYRKYKISPREREDALWDIRQNGEVVVKQVPHLNLKLAMNRALKQVASPEELEMVFGDQGEKLKEAKFNLVKHTAPNGDYKSDYKPVDVKFRDAKDALDKLVIDKMTAPATTKSDARETARVSDTFHTDAAHDLAAKLKKYAAGTASYSDVLDCVYEALEEIGERIMRHYGDAANHAPGVGAVKVKFDPDDISAEDIDKVLAQFPAFVEGQNIDKWNKASREVAKRKT